MQGGAQEVRDSPSQLQSNLICLPPSPGSPSAVSMMTSSHRSYFISQINLQNSTEILCVLIAPVKTSEKLPSAVAVEAARLGDALPGPGTRGGPGRCLPPAQPGLAPGGLSAVCLSVADPSDPPPTEPPSPAPHQEAARGRSPPPDTGVPVSCPSCTPQSRGSGRPRRQCRRTQGPSAPPRSPRILTGRGGFLGGQPLEVDVALQHGAARCPVPVRPGRAASRRGGYEVTP